MRLYEYSEAFVELESMLERGEIDEEIYLDTIESMSMGADEKAENIAKMIDNFTAHRDSLEEEAKALKERAKTINNKLEWLLNSLETYLKATGKEKHNVGIYRLGYRKLPDIVEFTDEKKIPAVYKQLETIIKISKRDISKALKDGEEVPGATLVTDRTKFEIKK